MLKVQQFLNGFTMEIERRLNTRALRKLKQSLRELFLLFDQPNVLALPKTSYEFAEWKIAAVNIDYHVKVDAHYYSVPYQLKHHPRTLLHRLDQPS